MAIRHNALPPQAAAEDQISNERRYRAEVDRSFRAADSDLRKLLDATGAYLPRWSGPAPAAAYRRGALVRDTGWLMYANADTATRPAPQPSGPPAWLTGLGASPGWATTSPTTASLTFGVRLIASAARHVRSFRFWAITGQAYTPSVVRSGVTSALWEVTATATGWFVFDFPPDLVLAGETVDYLVTARNPGGPTVSYVSIAGGWTGVPGVDGLLNGAASDIQYGADVSLIPMAASSAWDAVVVPRL